MLTSIYEYCRAKACVEEGFPFGESALVFKVVGKMFALVSLDVSPMKMNLKCNPLCAIELRESYESIRPGYHMNKQHWNTIDLDDSIPNALLFEMIDHSYDLVVAGLTKAQKAEIKNV